MIRKREEWIDEEMDQKEEEWDGEGMEGEKKVYS